MRRIKSRFEFMYIEVSLKFFSRSGDKTYTRNRTETTPGLSTSCSEGVVCIKHKSRNYIAAA